MVRPDGINLLNLVRKRRRFVDEQLEELVWCRFACKELKLLVYCPAPCDDDTRAYLDFLVSVCGWMLQSGTYDNGAHRVEDCE